MLFIWGKMKKIMLLLALSLIGCGKPDCGRRDYFEDVCEEKRAQRERELRFIQIAGEINYNLKKAESKKGPIEVIIVTPTPTPTPTSWIGNFSDPCIGRHAAFLPAPCCYGCKEE